LTLILSLSLSAFCMQYEADDLDDRIIC
jgi:hypothetical protein